MRWYALHLVLAVFCCPHVIADPPAESIPGSMIRLPTPNQLDLAVQFAKKKVELAETAVKEIELASRQVDLPISEARQPYLRLAVAKLELDKAMAERTYRLKMAQINVTLWRKKVDLARLVFEGAIEVNRREPDTIPEPEVQRYRLHWELCKIQLDNAQVALGPERAK